MRDLELSATGVSATALWFLAFGLVLLSFWTTMQFAATGCIVSAGAATLNIRGFFCTLAARERNAFEAGREVGPVHAMK